MALSTGKSRLLTPRLARAGGPVTYKPRPPVRIAAKAVGNWVPKLTQKAFEKHGFSTAALLTDWAQIAGADVARYTLPERLKWPRGVETYGEVDGSGAGRPGATLILKVDPARALDIQYKTAQLIERINVYFGYKAVTDLRILQTPIDAPAASAKPVQPPRPAHPKPQALASVPALDAVTDDALRAALQKLQAGVAKRNRAA